MGVSGIFLKATSSQILAFQCDRVFLPVAQSLMHATIISILIFFDLFYVLGSECGWAFGEGSSFQLVRGPQI